MDTILEFDKITKSYNKKKVLQEICMTIGRGEICGLVGANGAGKTTMMKLALGLISANAGLVKLNLIKKGNVGVLLDYPALDKNLSVRQNIEAHCRMCGFPMSAVNESIDFWNIAEFSKKKVKKLSKGMKQKTALLIAFMGMPELIILDEPANGLDPYGVRELREKIIYMNSEFGTTFLISSHIIDELVKVTSRCALLKDCKTEFVIAETAKIEEAFFETAGLNK